MIIIFTILANLINYTVFKLKSLVYQYYKSKKTIIKIRLKNLNKIFYKYLN